MFFSLLFILNYNYFPVCFMSLFGFLLLLFLQVIVGDGKLDLTKNSLLLYLDKLNDTESWEKRTNLITNETFSLKQACIERKYTSTVYYRMLYFRYCLKEESNSSDSSFDGLCSDLISYHENSSHNLLASIQKQATKYQILGHGSAANQLWLAYQTCQYVKSYFDEKKEIQANLPLGTNHQFVYPNYTEWLIHTVPFSLPVACGFTRKFYDDQQEVLSSAYCLPSSYKAVLFFIIAFDIVILFVTTMASVIILLSTPKMKIAKTPHGYMRMSLAVADLLSGVIICGAMNTTYTLFFTQHKFNEEGEKAKSLDYHDQNYIDGFGAVSILSLSASVFTLVVISLDRFAAIHRPISYTLRIHKMKVNGVMMIIAVWGLSFFLAIFPVFRSDLVYTFTAIGLIIAPNFFLAYVVCLGTSLLLVWILNIALYLSVTNRPTVGETLSPPVSTNTQTSENFTQTHTNRDQGSRHSFGSIHSKRSSVPNIEVSQRKKRINPRKRLELSLAVTVRLIVVTFTLALLPAMIVMGTGLLATVNAASSRFNPLSKTIWTSFSYIASRILFSNSFANCFIYSYRSSEFRKTVKSFLSCTKTRNSKTLQSYAMHKQQR